jgi:hypothetical protein
MPDRDGRAAAPIDLLRIMRGRAQWPLADDGGDRARVATEIGERLVCVWRNPWNVILHRKISGFRQ